MHEKTAYNRFWAQMGHRVTRSIQILEELLQYELFVFNEIAFYN